MLKRRQRAIVGFFLIYLTFVGMLVALLLFTPGLELREEQGKVFVKNNSVHVVKDIKVELSDNTPIDCIAQLGPGSSKELYVPDTKRPAKIIAFAPFHATVEKTLLPLGTESLELSHKITYATPVAKGKEFTIKLELCSENADISISITESHEQRFFKEKSQTRLMVVGKGKCRAAEFQLTPQETGTASVSFALEAENYSKTIIEEIKVN
ncbi:MAG: hypothetical protein NT067_05020 [Candidatus Diapherotrites archaeon]|nr:hypothetical protein [Candidatus Diapherotrites archaeon]